MRNVIAAAVLGLFLTPSLLPAQVKLPQDQKPQEPLGQKPDDKKPQKPDPGEIFKPEKPDTTIKKPEGPSLNTPLGGKTIDQWIALIPNKDPSKSQLAIQAVMMFGPELGQRAVPTMNKLLKNYLELDVSVRVNLVMAVGELLHEDNKPAAIEVQYAVTALIKMLKDDQLVVCLKSAEALGKIGTAANSALMPLTKTVMNGSTWELRYAAAHSLGQIASDKKNPPTKEVINALYGSAVADPAYQVRMAAIQAFVWLGPFLQTQHQAPVFAALADVGMKDQEPTVQLWAHMALMAIEGKTNATSVKGISDLLKHKDVVVRVQAAQALATMGKEAKGQLMALVAALEDEEKMVVGWSIVALSQLGGFAKPAEPALQKIVEDKEWPKALREMAQQTLNVIQGKAVTENKDGKDTKDAKEKQPKQGVQK
jgi:HEAT repeat protein